MGGCERDPSRSHVSGRGGGWAVRAATPDDGEAQLNC